MFRATKFRGDSRRHLPSVLAPGAAVLLSVLVLLAFLQVVQGAVDHAELRRRTEAVHVAAIRRCDVLRGAEPRETCLSQLGRAP